MDNKSVQMIAEKTIDYAESIIRPGKNLLEIRRLLEEKMFELGADSFWYYDIGALVFSGKETILSVSGKEYETSDRLIDENDLITIDLSPQCKRVWGDYARTIVVENGKVIKSISDIQNTELKKGLQFEKALHSFLINFVNEDTTFEDVYFYINDLIEKNGYVNLDFKGNLGHSINRYKFQRTYIEKNNKRKLSSVKYFTFEPHISEKNSDYGFKREDIYYLKNGKLSVL